MAHPYPLETPGHPGSLSVHEHEIKPRRALGERTSFGFSKRVSEFTTAEQAPLRRKQFFET